MLLLFQSSGVVCNLLYRQIVGIPIGTNCAPLVFISRFGFKSGIFLLIAPVPVQFFSITFIGLTKFHSVDTNGCSRNA